MYYSAILLEIFREYLLSRISYKCSCSSATAGSLYDANSLLSCIWSLQTNWAPWNGFTFLHLHTLNLQWKVWYNKGKAFRRTAMNYLWDGDGR